MKRIALILLLLPVLAWAGPSPNLIQLNVGCYTYSNSIIWASTQQASDYREWYANHYGFMIGSGTGAGERVDTMKGYNTELKALVYQLYLLSASDTTTAENWANSVGVDFDSMIIRAKTGSGDSLKCRIGWNVEESGFSRWVVTQPGQVLLTPGFTDEQTRFAWDYRNPNVGSYLAYRWKVAIEAINYDGAFVDEENIAGYTGHNTAGHTVPQYPFRYAYPCDLWDTTGYNQWYHTQNAWDSTLTHYIYGNVPDSGSAVRDSLNILRDGWMGTAGDSMQSWGYYYAPNFAAIPHNGMANWDTEGRHCAILAGSYILGEYSFNYPSYVDAGGGGQKFCNEAKEACYDIRDSTVSMFVGWIRMGQYDSSATDSFTIARSRMNGLGFMLDCLFPGNSTYYFSPCVKNGQVDFGHLRTVNGITLPDSLTHWDCAWGKYFGEPLDTRDTSETGVDGAGQEYTIHKVALFDSAGSSDTLTYAIGRYGNKINRRIGETSVYTNLPAGTWWELESGGTWGDSYADSILVANAQWRIFSSDTTFSNTGTGGNGNGGASVGKMKGWHTTQ